MKNPYVHAITTLGTTLVAKFRNSEDTFVLNMKCRHTCRPSESFLLGVNDKREAITVFLGGMESEALRHASLSPSSKCVSLGFFWLTRRIEIHSKNKAQYMLSILG